MFRTRSPFWSMILPLACLLFLAGCDRQLRYNAVVGRILHSGFVNPETKAIPLMLTSSGNNHPLAAKKVEILSQDQPLVLRTDKHGIISLPVSPLYREENPWIRLGGGPLTRLVYTTQLSATINSEDQRRKWVKLDGLERRGNKHVVVFFDKSIQGQVVPRITEMLRKQYLKVVQITGFEPVHWGVVILPKMEEGVSYLTPEVPGLPALWSYSLKSLDNGHFSRTNTHEWTEATIEANLGLHESDPRGRNRIHVDGLAELAAYDAGGLTGNEIGSLQHLIDEGREYVDLIKAFHTVRSHADTTFKKLIKKLGSGKLGAPTSYTLSFVFWHRLRAKYGPDLPRRFLHVLSQRSDRDFEATIEVLSELTGIRQPVLLDRLRHADMHRAVAYLKAMNEKKEDARTGEP